MPGHDIVVIGASAGGVELLLNLVPELPEHLPASLFVVLHTAPDFLSPLPELLSARGPLPAEHPVHGESIARGRIYVAPPDDHLQVQAGFVEVVRGARENGHRPAVDALFRTASRAYGPRVVGIVLSGFQDCGTAGMMSIRARGGVTVVQDPATAAAPEMPQSVLASVAVDHVVHPLELPGLIARLAAEPAGGPTAAPPELPALEGDARGAPAEVVCPDCHGVLTEATVGGFRRYRCHEGHAYSVDALARAQGEEVERALWAAARALDEDAALSRRLARTSPRAVQGRFADREATQRRHAELLRRILLDDTGPRSEPSEAEAAPVADDERPGAP